MSLAHQTEIHQVHVNGVIAHLAIELGLNKWTRIKPKVFKLPFGF